MVVIGCESGCIEWGVGVLGGVGGWVSEFWTSGIVYMLILTISMNIVCLTQFGQKSGVSEFWKKTLFNLD